MVKHCRPQLCWRFHNYYICIYIFFSLVRLQSDIVHQSVYELVHSEDREELQRQLMWNSFLPPEQSGITLQEAILPENSHLLERNFTVRFRCLLDNTSGFLVKIMPLLKLFTLSLESAHVEVEVRFSPATICSFVWHSPNFNPNVIKPYWPR